MIAAALCVFLGFESYDTVPDAKTILKIQK